MIAVLGATGYTGGLVCAAARELDLPLRLVGRRRDRLARAARQGEEVGVADARDERVLRSAFDGVAAVVSLAGPFVDVGPAPVAAAIAVGAHYLDSSGEQPFARLVHERFGRAAEDRGSIVLTSFGFDYVPGDLAARLAAEGLEPLDEVVAAYSILRVNSSRGTRRTMARVLTQPLVAYDSGRLVATGGFGSEPRRVRFPSGARIVVRWGGTEPLTVPRHTAVRRVDSYLRVPAPVTLVRLGRAAAPLARIAGAVGAPGPSAASRARTRSTIVAEARGPAGARRVTLEGRDPYDITARLLAVGARLLVDGEARGAGTLAPAEAFDARALLGRLEPLLRLRSVEDL